MSSPHGVEKSGEVVGDVKLSSTDNIEVAATKPLAGRVVSYYNTAKDYLSNMSTGKKIGLIGTILLVIAAALTTILLAKFGKLHLVSDAMKQKIIPWVEQNIISKIHTALSKKIPGWAVGLGGALGIGGGGAGTGYIIHKYRKGKEEINSESNPAGKGSGTEPVVVKNEGVVKKDDKKSDDSTPGSGVEDKTTTKKEDEKTGSSAGSTKGTVEGDGGIDDIFYGEGETEEKSSEIKHDHEPPTGSGVKPDDKPPRAGVVVTFKVTSTAKSPEDEKKDGKTAAPALVPAPTVGSSTTTSSTSSASATTEVSSGTSTTSSSSAKVDETEEKEMDDDIDDGDDESEGTGDKEVVVKKPPVEITVKKTEEKKPEEETSFFSSITKSLFG